MRKKLITGGIIFVVLLILGVGFWAYRSGKLAGLADVIKPSPTPTQVKINVKDNKGKNLPSTDIQMSIDNSYYQLIGQTDSVGNLSYPLYQQDGTKLYFKAFLPMHSSPSPGYETLTVNRSITTQYLNFVLTAISIPTGKGAINGKVTASGKPLVQAQISLYTTSNVATGNNDWTKDDGTYLLNSLNPGTYNIAAFKSGYKENRKTSITVKADQITPIDFNLDATASPSPSSSSSASPSPSTQPDRNNFIFTAEVVDEGTQQLIKDVKVSIKISPAINGAVETTGTTKENPIDAAKYGNNNLWAKVPYPSDCYSYNTKYTVEFSHPAYETQTLPDFYCSDIHFSDNLQTYFYNAHKVSLKETVPKNIIVTGRVFNKETGDLLDGFEVMLEYENGKQRFSRTTAIEYTKIGNYNFDVWDFSSKETYKVKLDYNTGTWTGDFSGEMKFNPEEVEFTYQDGKIRYDSNLRRFVATIDFEVDLGYLKVIVKEGGGKPLEKARVELFDSGFGFSETQFTDSEGMTRFNSLKRFKYCHDSGTLGSRGIKLSAKGYVTKIKINEDYCHAGEVVLNYYLGKIDTSKGSLIKGSVYGIEKGWGSHYLEGAKVSLWSDLKGDAGKSTTTDSQGKFEFNMLEEGQYLISAFHYDYKSTTISSQAIKLEDGEQIDIGLLGLEKMPPSGVLDKLVVAVYRKTTLEPVKEVLVTATTSENVIWREYTDLKGEASFGSVFLGESLLVKIIKKDTNEVLDERKVIVPLDYYDLDDKDRATFWSQLVFLVDDGKASPPKEVKIIVEDDETKKPIAGAEVIVYPFKESDDPMSRLFKSFQIPDSRDKFLFFKEIGFRSITNNQGETSLPKDFVFYDPDNNLAFLPDSIREEFKKYLYTEVIGGGLSSFKIQKEGYEDLEVDMWELRGKDEYKVSLTKKQARLIVITIDHTQYNIGTNNETLDKLILEKQEGSKFVQVNNPDKDYLKRKGVAYKGLKAGTYRVSAPGLSSSGSVYFDSVDDKVIYYGFCSQQTDSKIINAGDGIYLNISGEEAQNLYNTNKKIFDEIIIQIKSLKRKSKDVGNLLISVVDGEGAINASAIPIYIANNSCFGIKDIQVMNVTTDYIKWAAQQKRSDDITFTMAHEYGHLVYGMFKKTDPNFSDKWYQLFEKITLQSSSLTSCVWNAFKDGNVGMSPRSFGGHPGDDEDEMFASFYSSYYMYHDRLYGIIKYHVATDSPCQNILKYMWQLFSEDVGKIYSNDNRFFLPVGGKIGKTEYTWQQIINGSWIKGNYDKLPTGKKAMLQLQRYVISYMTRSASFLTNKINQFNLYMDSLLAGRDTGRVIGRVVDSQNMPVVNVVIRIGPKAGITDEKGRFRMNRIPVGINKISVIKDEEKNYKIIYPVLKEADINKNKASTINLKIDK